MALLDHILVCVESGTAYISNFRNTYGSNLTIYSNDSYVYNVPSSEWIKIKEFGGTYYAVAVVSGRTIQSESALNVRNSGTYGTKKFVFDRKYTYTISDPDLYGGMNIQPYLLTPWIPKLSSLSIYIDGSLVSSSTTITVGGSKDITVYANLEDGTSFDCTPSWTYGTSNIVEVV